MRKQKRPTLIQAGTITMLILGIALVVTSSFYASSFLAILGVAITFWGAILLYITPAKHIPLDLLNAAAETHAFNIERILTELEATQNGIYLPPKNLQNPESSIVFIPTTQNTKLPTAQENNQKLLNKTETGIYLTPPGTALSKFFEQELGSSFTRIDLDQLQTTLPKLGVENLELAENIEINATEKTVTVQLTKNIFRSLCEETEKHPSTHKQVGCLFSSALACILAKTTGKPVSIQNETYDPSSKTTTIEFQILED